MGYSQYEITHRKNTIPGYIPSATPAAMDFDAAWDLALQQEQEFLNAWDEAEQKFQNSCKRRKRIATSDPYLEYLDYTFFFLAVFISESVCTYCMFCVLGI